MVLLPVGSVVKLEEANKKLMIIGILQKNGDGEVYDYFGCPYPEGFLDADNIFLFNHNDIEDISFIGYDDIERQLFIKNLEKELQKQ